jgi:hypothetical protein
VPDSKEEAAVNAFIVEAKNEPGKLAEVSKAIADKGVNIVTGAVISIGQAGGFAFISNDEAGTRTALRDANYTFREVEVMPISVSDEPGSLAKIAKKLADAGVNVEVILPTGMSGNKMTLALGVDKIDAARKAIGTEVATPA